MCKLNLVLLCRLTKKVFHHFIFHLKPLIYIYAPERNELSMIVNHTILFTSNVSKRWHNLMKLWKEWLLVSWDVVRCVDCWERIEHTCIRKWSNYWCTERNVEIKTKLGQEKKRKLRYKPLHTYTLQVIDRYKLQIQTENLLLRPSETDSAT